MKLRPIAVLTALALLTGCAAPAQATDPAPAVPQSELRLLAPGPGSALNEQGYHVSIGLSREDRSPIQTEALIKQAEFHMYEEKQRYYEESAAGSCRLPAQP